MKRLKMIQMEVMIRVQRVIERRGMVKKALRLITLVKRERTLSKSVEKTI